MGGTFEIESGDAIGIHPFEFVYKGDGLIDGVGEV